jgi:hypothetical protein
MIYQSYTIKPLHAMRGLHNGYPNLRFLATLYTISGSNVGGEILWMRYKNDITIIVETSRPLIYGDSVERGCTENDPAGTGLKAGLRVQALKTPRAAVVESNCGLR